MELSTSNNKEAVVKSDYVNSRSHEVEWAGNSQAGFRGSMANKRGSQLLNVTVCFPALEYMQLGQQ